MSKEDNIVDFKFDTYAVDYKLNALDNIELIEKHYNKIFKQYFKIVRPDTKDKIKLTIENPAIKNLSKSIKEDLDTDSIRMYKSDDVKLINPYNDISQVTLLNGTSYVGSFLITGLNNCCGAMTTQNTCVSENYSDNKIGTIFQCMKEDLAKANSVSFLTCTNIIYGSYSENRDGNIDNLGIYCKNHKLLLNTGWVLTDKFFNTKSNNVVGLFTKKINKKEEFKTVIVKLTINKNNNILSKIEDVTIGCDPEAFFKSKETGEFVPSFYVMGGDKNNPTPITEDGHSIQCDNVMVEWNIPPAKTAKEFVEHNLLVQNYIKDKICEPNDLELVITPSARFDEFNLTDERAKRMGCDPDYDAWNSGKPNQIVSATSNLRTGAGHLHIGYKDHNYATNLMLVRLVDLYVNVPLVLMEPDNERKTMYGKAGAFRHQKHGVEVRTPGNYIFSSPELMTWAFNQVKQAIDDYNTKKIHNWDIDSSSVVAINKKDKKLAEKICNRHNINIPTLKEA